MTQPETVQTADELGRALQPRHLKVADTYLTNGLNARQAGKAHGYRNLFEGSRLLSRPEVAAYVQARLDEAGMTKAEITARLQYFADGSMADFVRIAPTERSYWVRADAHEEVREQAKRRGVAPGALDELDLSGLFGSDAVAQTEDGVLMIRVSTIEAEVIIDWRAAEQQHALGRIKKLKTNKDGSVEFELHDAMRAQELLGKAQRMFTEKVELAGPDGGPVQVQITRRIIGGEL